LETTWIWGAFGANAVVVQGVKREELVRRGWQRVAGERTGFVPFWFFPFLLFLPLALFKYL
jgi:hypothetical protein